MPFAEDIPFGIDNRDPQHPAVIEFKTKAGSNPFGRIHLHGAFNAKEAGNGHAGTFRHSLKTTNLICDGSKRLAVLQQLPSARAFFDEFHHDGHSIAMGKSGDGI